MSECIGKRTEYRDPLYGCQWHLRDRVQVSYGGQGITGGEDINVEGAWNAGIHGRGVNVVLVGEGMDLLHEDLAANVRSGLNYNYTENGEVSGFAGTRAAGVTAAAGDNGVGVRGVAPRAGIYGYNLSGDLSEADVKEAMTRNRVITAVSFNDWGPEDGPVLQEASEGWEEGVELGIREGFYGRGVFYVFGAGDGHEYNDQGNFNEYSSYHAVTATCSTDRLGRKSTFSEEGVNLWVCAPGSDILTTGGNDGYVTVSGTSYSAAQVSSVAALMREVNGKLSWRDIKLILAGSARQNDPSDPGWETGAVKYDLDTGYGSDTENYKYNPKYGFGVVDAAAAVKLAGSWKHVGEMKTLTASSGDVDTVIPDSEDGADGAITSVLTIPDTEELSFTEFTEVELTFSHGYLPDLNVQMISPSGIVSQLVREFSGEAEGELMEDENFSYSGHVHRFGSARHLGEHPAGDWTLKISDTASGALGTLHSWSIKVYGHGKGDTVPDSGSEVIPKHHAVSFGNNTISDKVYLTGDAVSLTLPEATGGTPPLIYGLFGTLPRGLIWNSRERVISGTPDTPMSETTYTYVASESGSSGDSDTLIFSITVERGSTPSFGSAEIDDQLYVVQTLLNLPVTLPEATGGSGTLTYRLTPALPSGSGLSFDASTRMISGVPANAMSSTMYTYYVEDQQGIIDTLMFNITVERNVAPSFGSETIDDQFYTVGVPVTVTLPVATGGNIALRYGINETLPTGLDFDASTRTISGTPATAMSSSWYQYYVLDADGSLKRLGFNITVGEPGTFPSFGSETITDKEYIIGDTVTETLPAATGGSAPLVYSLNKTLPAGLDFDEATRVISGTITSTQLGYRIYMYTVTDADGVTVELTFRITVEEDIEPAFDDTTISTQMVYTAGRPLTLTLPEAEGGNPPVTYSITPPLPSGLSFNSNTRVISGTPARASSGTYTYTVTDRNKDTAKVRFMLRVTNPPDRRPPPAPTPDNDAGGGGGCAVSDHKGVGVDIFAVMACLILIPVSIAVRKKRRSYLNIRS